MKFVITGGSGLIGGRVVEDLSAKNHSLVLLSRTARSPAGSNVTWTEWQPARPGAWQKELDGADGVIHLAGEPIAAKRWSEAQKERLFSSRVDSTRLIVEAIANARQKPKFFISGSAVGYYGGRGDEVLTEQSAPGTDFLGRLCVAWEAEANKAKAHGLRVALIRTGIVLATGKGALAKMVPPFKLFAGGRLGSGQQWFPWIHVDDEVGLIRFVVENDNAEGPFNATAPNPVTMDEFCKTLGRVLNRPSWAPVPASALSLVLGEMADMLLNGQRALPEAAQKLGYEFRYPRLSEALAALKL